MIIAVLADYESAPVYNKFMQLVEICFRDECRLDLSRHQGNDWKKRDLARVKDIEEAHLVIVCSGWQNNMDVRHDLWEAQRRKKEIYIEFNGTFVPFNTYTARV
ncbi:MAG: hypothetical protein WCJ95_21650 [Mariniphaga sp.]